MQEVRKLQNELTGTAEIDKPESFCRTCRNLRLSRSLSTRTMLSLSQYERALPMRTGLKSAALDSKGGRGVYDRLTCKQSLQAAGAAVG